MSPVRPAMHYVYVLLSAKDGRFYTGCTSDLKTRFRQHQEGKVTSTKHRLPMNLIYYEACTNKLDAFTREKYLKSGMGKRYIRKRTQKALGLTG